MAAWAWAPLLLCACWAVAGSHSSELLYGKAGDSASLSANLSAVSTSISWIVWRHGDNLAAEWDGNTFDYYRQFKHRAAINITTGSLTIGDLMINDSGLYKVDINRIHNSQMRIRVIAPVPKPAVKASCDEGLNMCTLSCEGDFGDAEPISISWTHKSAHYPEKDISSSKETVIMKGDYLDQTEFSCTVENPVSQESSAPVSNPLVESSPSLNPKTGLMVFIALTTVVTVLMFFHRYRTGEWFFQKAPLPCKEFWSRRDVELPQGEGAATTGEKLHNEGEQLHNEEEVH